ncbi:DUF342 domain-containing protein [bacterium]|nr:DUF342 domain-containing protein [bacterium]
MGLNPADYKIEISDDRLIATLTLVNRELAGSYTPNDLKDVINSAKVVQGVLEDQLANLVVAPQFGESVVVARGKQPPCRLISEVTYLFETGQPGQSAQACQDPGAEGEEEQPEEVHGDEHGRVDLKEVQHFQNVREGDVLAKRTVITPQMCGIDVHGQPIEPEFKKASAPKAGRGAELDEATGTITATLTGHAMLKAGKVSVMDTLDISGDVDYSVGNLDFIGNVRVMGSVHPGFHIKTGSDLVISGNVDRASIECGGNLTINGIVFGAGETVIKVGGNAQVEALDQCELSVRGDLHVLNYMRHCNASIGGSLQVESHKGNLVGGEVHVYRNVDVTSLGSKMAALTKLTVGRNPFSDSNPDELRAQIQENEGKLRQVSLGIETLKKRLQATGSNLDLQQRLGKLMQAEAQFQPLLEGLRIQLEEAQKNAAYFREAVISVHETVYPGVVVNFRDKMQYKTMDSMSNMCFYEHEAEIKTKPL